MFALQLILVGCSLGPAPEANRITNLDPGSGETSNSVGVPAGTFTMGRKHSIHTDQIPAHQVVLDAFVIDATLVTMADFRAFVDQTGHLTSAEIQGFGKTAVLGMKDWEWRSVPGANWRQPWGAENAATISITDDMPVTMVSWLDANAYCSWRAARLPTEAEWEYAMRAGSETRFPWGNTPVRPDGLLGLNYWEGATHAENALSDGFLYLSPVRAFPPNNWGIYDPAGNVWQWTADWYAADTFAKNAAAGPDGVRNPTGPEIGTHKVARGGSWWCSTDTCGGYGLTIRGKTLPNAPFSNNGFRCVVASK